MIFLQPATTHTKVSFVIKGTLYVTGKVVEKISANATCRQIVSCVAHSPFLSTHSCLLVFLPIHVVLITLVSPRLSPRTGEKKRERLEKESMTCLGVIRILAMQRYVLIFRLKGDFWYNCILYRGATLAHLVKSFSKPIVTSIIPCH